MDKFSYMGNIDIAVIDQMYRQYKNDPDSVESTWQRFFEGFEFARTQFNGEFSDAFDKEFKVINLINGYRKRGHLFTNTNPVRTRRKYFPTLDLENYDLSEKDIDTEFHAGKEIGIGKTKLSTIVEYLEKTYCTEIGSEFMFIRKPDKINWLQHRIESTQNSTKFSREEKLDIYHHLKNAVGFEKFIHKKFVGQKRFSIEGAEILIPALNKLIERGAEKGVKEYTIAMAHRGRLNVLANVLQKPASNIFKEFEGEEYEESIALGDVKYHLGYGNTIKIPDGKEVTLNLTPNPSHLESSTPVIQGIARAMIEQQHDWDNNRLIPIVIHGDAAIAGQGVVYEVIQMSELNGYKTGGTIHIVINNQVGFTTSYLDARSSTYCTDVGKVTKSPIFHVNGDDAEALVHVVRMAVDYRQTFHTDVFIDILAYRKYGHNEGDEPRFTQPLLYKAIANHPNPRDIYKKQLAEEGVLSPDEAKNAEDALDEELEKCLEKAREMKKVVIPQFLKEEWAGFKYAHEVDFTSTIETGVDGELLTMVANQVNTLPDEYTFISKTKKLFNERRKMIREDRLDWALGEQLAYATLLLDGHPVRISGQDSMRGTFSHRHAGLVIEDSDENYIPLHHLSDKQAKFNIYNSPLNEYGVLGFEYGYAMVTPNTLTIWEAQFGDFFNVAQVIVDQYISSAEEKWGVMNGLVLYLPHGFEGQGPEHSSARIERFLNMAANNNMHLANVTTPANLFHLLRRHMKKPSRVPLVIFTPKSLLRHPKCVSKMEDFQKGGFLPLIDDADTERKEVRRVVFCSGKIYYDLLKRKEELGVKDIALIRLEQLHPFPAEEVKKIIRKYSNNMLTLWVQEEPENMGPWYYIQNKMKEYDVVPVTRLASGSPATGLFKIHEIGQDELIEKVFRECTCELQNVYCGLQCVIGGSRKEILKQHYYFDEKGKS
ncbi:MAG: 2-oxoglutarate dehydrogenase E1 component [Bacteroidales bacterium]|nr:2-oxoglutarate dehydrogenase E1 component [Bacteroidales bacterium]MDT8432762.1 2-oxoglutarate dehydrogenase E1 component [Bacteroidales bacterium]